VILLDTSVLSRVFRRQRMGPAERRFESLVEELMASETPLPWRCGTGVGAGSP